MKDFIKSHFNDEKLSKELELNEKMTIDNNYQEDEFSKINRNLSKEVQHG